MEGFFKVFCALILLVLMLLWFDVEKISTAFDETSVKPYTTETELHQSDASWGKHRGCFILADQNANTKHKQLWSQCLLHCALAGFYYSALNQMKCSCLEPRDCNCPYLLLSQTRSVMSCLERVYTLCCTLLHLFRLFWNPSYRLSQLPKQSPLMMTSAITSATIHLARSVADHTAL